MKKQPRETGNLKKKLYSFFHTSIKDHIKNAWAWMKPYVTTWQGVLGMLIAWCLIDGWPYVFVAIGTIKNIPWMLSVGLVAEAILWQPWMIEKPLVVIPLGSLFKKLFDKLSAKRGGLHEPSRRKPDTDGNKPPKELARK